MYVYGKKVVEELLRSTHPLGHVVVAYETDERFGRFIQTLCERRNLSIIRARKAELQKYCGPVLHQGVAAFIEGFVDIPETMLLQKIKHKTNPLLIILDQIQDPHNLGAILRSAEASGVDAVLLPRKGSSDITPTVAKTSAGAVFHLPVCFTDDLYHLIDLLKKQGIQVFGLHTVAKQTIYEADMSQTVALIIGSEGIGIRKNVLSQCDQTVLIPQVGKVNSLNASVAAAVTLFEIVRQRLAARPG